MASSLSCGSFLKSGSCLFSVHTDADFHLWKPHVLTHLPAALCGRRPAKFVQLSLEKLPDGKVVCGSHDISI